MAEVKTTYAVALTFSGGIDEMLKNLREDYQEYMKYTIVPHITLVYPFVPIFSLFRVNEKLQDVAKKTKPFPIILNGIGYFEGTNNVIYAAIEHKKAVRKLHTDIIRSLDGLIKEWYTDGKYNLEKFVPHVTIGEKIPADVLPDVKKKFSRCKLHYESDIADFSLFSEENGGWQVTQVFDLGGKRRV